MTLLEARGLDKTYRRSGNPVRAIRCIDLSVASGDRLGIVGESGSGKSTLVRMLAGLLEPSFGQVLYRGNPINGANREQLRELRRGVQMVFQDPRSSLNPRMRIGDIIAEPLFSPVQPRSIRAHAVERVAELMDLVELDDVAPNVYPHELSGGQRQRVAIARALAPAPEVLIADEAVSALDVSVRAHVLNLITDLVATQNLTLVFVSHDLTVVRHLCDRMVVMRDGVIVEQGRTEAIHANPTDDYTARLLASVPRLPGH
ncbi:hypothetical protein HMPREF1531_01967 [Propionibacterium sp. oral taxon 192 str. F0372]|nr:ABC transporter ATP-binding protein [Propionibacterium sp. oral taxon 192]EPH02657.1 hypothetical protein HMPREF1531_01967 [Propionibacterium sp. oral taxon 192 str. F0372]